jgi:hypothetical protein
MPALVDLSGATLQRQIFSASLNFGPGTFLTVEEDPTDDSVITQHPVDSSAVMSDHWYIQPPELKLRLGWSNADPQATGPTYVRDVYSSLLQLKNNRQLCTVYTGKRFYYNMGIPSLRGPVTNPRFEYSMLVDLIFRQVLLVSLATATSAPTSVNAAPNPQGTASPQTNQPTQNTGFNQLRSAGPANQATGIPSGEISDTTSGGSPADAVPGIGAPNNNAGGAGPADYYQAAA